MRARRIWYHARQWAANEPAWVREICGRAYLPDGARESIDALSAVAEACDDPRKMAKLIQREANACNEASAAHHETVG